MATNVEATPRAAALRVRGGTATLSAGEHSVAVTLLQHGDGDAGVAATPERDGLSVQWLKRPAAATAEREGDTPEEFTATELAAGDTLASADCGCGARRLEFSALSSHKRLAFSIQLP